MNEPAYFEDGYALLIGLGYGHWPKKLPSPLKDVDALKSHFSDLYKAAYSPDNILVLKESEATTNNILKALDDLAVKVAAKPNATVLVYYSGHGAYHDDKYFLVPYDFNLSAFQTGKLDEQHIIQTSQFAEKINAIQGKKCIVMLDCCHAEAMPVEKGLLQKTDFIEGFANELDAEITSPAREKTLMPQLDKGSGRVILTSCQSEETSLDLGSLSLFTKVLLESLSGKENIEQDGWVRLIDLIRYVPKNVVEIAKSQYSHEQHPVFKRIENLSSEDFVICAYDSTLIKGLKNGNTIKDHDTKADLIELLNTGAVPELFKVLDNRKITDQFQYNRFKREYSAGIKGVDLIDFSDRLKVFINGLN